MDDISKLTVKVKIPKTYVQMQKFSLLCISFFNGVLQLIVNSSINSLHLEWQSTLVDCNCFFFFFQLSVNMSREEREIMVFCEKYLY